MSDTPSRTFGASTPVLKSSTSMRGLHSREPALSPDHCYSRPRGISERPESENSLPPSQRERGGPEKPETTSRGGPNRRGKP
jgi:hypothetical protein